MNKRTIKIKETTELKKLQMVEDYTTEKLLKELVFDPNMTLLQHIRYNSYKTLTIDDMCDVLETRLEELTIKEVNYLIEKDIIGRAYHDYEKYDCYDYNSLVDCVNMQIKDLLKERKKNSG